MKNFFMTWKEDNGDYNFLWFYTEEELREHVEVNQIDPIDAIEIFNSKEVEF